MAVRGVFKKQPPRDDLPEVLVAGGGIAGLITALSMQRRGMKVKVFEKVKEYKLFGGPIQLQCNAQGALDSIAPDVLEQIWAKSTITGDRINGLLDGSLGDWFYRFDTRQPCYNNGLPLTLVIARYDLLDILRNAVGEENIMMETVVEKYENVGDKVRATLTTGETFEGDVLVGADGIRSKMRAQMRNEDPENPPLAYAGMRCTPQSAITRLRTGSPCIRTWSARGTRCSSALSSTSCPRTSVRVSSSTTPSWTSPRAATTSSRSANNGRITERCF